MQDFKLIKTPHLGKEWKNQPGCLGKVRDKDLLDLACGTVIANRCYIKTNSSDMFSKGKMQELHDLIRQDDGWISSCLCISAEDCVIQSSWTSIKMLGRFLKDPRIIQQLDKLTTDVTIVHQFASGNTSKEYIRKEIPMDHKALREHHSRCTITIRLKTNETEIILKPLEDKASIKIDCAFGGL